MVYIIYTNHLMCSRTPFLYVQSETFTILRFEVYIVVWKCEGMRSLNKKTKSLGYSVQCLEFSVQAQCLEFSVQALGLKLQGLHACQGLQCRVHMLGFTTQCLYGNPSYNI